MLGSTFSCHALSHPWQEDATPWYRLMAPNKFPTCGDPDARKADTTNVRQPFDRQVAIPGEKKTENQGLIVPAAAHTTPPLRK